MTHERNRFYGMVDSLGITVMTGFPDYVVHPSKEEASASSRRDTILDPQTRKPVMILGQESLKFDTGTTTIRLASLHQAQAL